MNVHDVPMILFTVITQMCVGAFVTLGVLQLAASRRHSPEVVERVTHPVLYAIGPAMILGLAVSTLHMGYPLHALNVIRHWDSSWLSREIIFGCGFAGAGFLFAILEWFHKGSFALRRALAALTAVLGIGLVVCESMIYYSVETIPGWHSPFVPAAFFSTTILMGTLAVGCALMVTATVRLRTESRAALDTNTPEPSATGSALATQVRTRVKEINAPTTDEEWALTTRTIQWCTVAAAITAALTLAAYPVYISSLLTRGPTAQAAAQVFSGPMLVIRLVLLGIVVLLLGFFVFRTAGRTLRTNPRTLAILISAVFALALISELLGRALHYSALIRVGI